MAKALRKEDAIDAVMVGILADKEVRVGIREIHFFPALEHRINLLLPNRLHIGSVWGKTCIHQHQILFLVFVRAVHEAKWMNEMEISIYDCWASPDTCHKRMMLRKRAVQGGVSLKYLQDLQEKHESLLLPFESGSHGVLSVSKPSLQMDNSLHPDIKDHVFYLEGNHMHSSIQKVPALFLDCEPNIDFSRDIEAKRQYARQVAEFFEFV
ncbi:hypothetical protein DY000_02047253 [Brassica cretica]|uniref:Deoxynucleoside kinase domain-containing protein n=1 Tax=Brassica cretica TaxID=69181 RepID=A0ABQ7EU42_BRACR|nr:hypothetical protein DY000_02047253 [Brassica cretica]